MNHIEADACSIARSLLAEVQRHLINRQGIYICNTLDAVLNRVYVEGQGSQTGKLALNLVEGFKRSIAQEFYSAKVGGHAVAFVFSDHGMRSSAGDMTMDTSGFDGKSLGHFLHFGCGIPAILVNDLSDEMRAYRIRILDMALSQTNEEMLGWLG